MDSLVETGGDKVISEYNRLQGIYIENPSVMSSHELLAFLEMNRLDLQAPFRETRIKILEREINARQSLSDSQRRWQEEWTSAALEYKTLTEKWETAGAKWRSLESMVIWEYRGERFYHWFSGSLITKNIVEARKADKKLDELILVKNDCGFIS